MHRRSCIITLYGLIEKGFKEFCEKVAPTGSTLKPKDLAGRSGIYQYKNYLTKVCGSSWDKLNPEWEFISTNFRKIRNAYVHDPSNAEEKSGDYLYEAIGHVEGLFDKLVEEAKQSGRQGS